MNPHSSALLVSVPPPRCAYISYETSAEFNDKRKEYAQAIMAFTIIFAIARAAHTVIYALALPQVLRSVAWLLGQLSVLSLGILAVICCSKLPSSGLDIVDPPSF